MDTVAGLPIEPMSRSSPRPPSRPYFVRVPSELRALAPIKDVVNSLRRPYDDCAACGHIFREGEVTTLIPVGPGDDEIQRAQARAGASYMSAAVLVHVECAPPGVLPAAPESRRRLSSSRMPAADRASSSSINLPAAERASSSRMPAADPAPSSERSPKP